MNLKGSKTENNLKDAFAGESQANRRYLYFAKVADVEGYPEVAGNFRETAEGETGHAHGHLDYLKQVGDPATDQPFGSTDANLYAAGSPAIRVSAMVAAFDPLSRRSRRSCSTSSAEPRLRIVSDPTSSARRAARSFFSAIGSFPRTW